MIESATSGVSDAELGMSNEEWSRSHIELGTAGWEGDEDTIDQGGPENSGVTYVKVTLFDGARPGESVSERGFANGRRLKARMMAPWWYAPVFGEQCMVLFAPGTVETEGAGVCIPVSSPGSRKLPNAKPGEAIVFSELGAMMRYRKDGTLSIVSSTDGTPSGRSVYMSIGPKGIEMVTPWNRLTLRSDGITLRDGSGAQLSLSALAGLAPPFDALGSLATISAGAVKIEGSGVTLGTDNGATHSLSVTALQTILTALGVVIAAAVDPTGIPTAAKTAFATALSTNQPAVDNIGKIV